MNKLSFLNFPEMSYACSEAINTLCTNITFSGEQVKKIMMTSCHVAEGKSYLSMNIMRTLASLGYRVALVDADLRKSVINKRYRVQLMDVEHTQGLSQYLAGMAQMEEVVYETNLEGAYFVPVGFNVINSLQLLNSPRFSQLLDALAEQMDYVIVDAPPVGQIIDAAQIAKSCDGTLIAVKYNAVSRQELIDVRDQLAQTGCPILGTVLNQVEFDSYLNKKYYYKSYYYRSYYSHYGHERNGETDGKAGRRRKKHKA